MDLALIGTTVTLWGNQSMPKIELGPEVRYAAEKGWRKFLEQKYIIPSGTTCLDPAKRGVFFTDPSTRNVSGVIVRFAKGSVHFLPNPFAYDGINDPRTLSYLSTTIAQGHA